MPAGYQIVVPARKLGAGEVVDLVIMAEKSGWTGAWLSELVFLDASVLLGALAAQTSTIGLGTSIVPLGTRSAALLAMMASTIGQLAPGRFRLGLGASTPAIVDDRHDRATPHPVATAKGVLSVVKRAVRGEVVSHPADPQVTNLRVDAPPIPPPVYLAALGPRMVRVAQEHADGLILNLITQDRATEIARDGRRIAGPQFETVLTQRVCVSPSKEDLVSIRREIASYCRVEVYAASLARQGWDLDGLRSVAPDRAADALPDELLHELVVIGNEQECRDRFDALSRAGVTPVAVPIGVGDSTRRLLAQLGPG
jgi:alkanesulfonate monooxygenase SsuD/methylene tetrahydromethanopterin reductase-like flavin-dependent oxidoreductase (luciferase family)